MVDVRVALWVVQTVDVTAHSTVVQMAERKVELTVLSWAGLSVVVMAEG